MKYVQLGRSGLRVSRMALGTMNFGPRTSEDEAFQILDRALEMGINIIDTADRYGNPHGSGQTERIIGKWLKKTGNRNTIVLATKVFGPMGPGPNDYGLSAYHIRAACEASLERLGTDRIDIYQMHHFDRGIPHYLSKLEYLGGDINNLVFPKHLKPGVPWEEIWQQMQQLVISGKILYVGSSNFPGWGIAQANERARTFNLLGLVSEQSKYNLLQRTVELEVLPACREYGVGFFPYSPLSEGALAGKALQAEKGRRVEQGMAGRSFEQMDAFLSLCKEIGEQPSAVALAWLLSSPYVTAPIVGPRTLEQLESAFHALDIRLEPDFLQKLESVFPGPGYRNSEHLRQSVYDKLEEATPGARNQAPEAYAW
jgi:NDP-hexose C3-ketoreductase / dTDP-4-oxo-2-deoxy-alpha-D-pentos-2-ene 2,3-reductase